MSRRRRARVALIGGLCLAAVIGLVVRSGAKSRTKRRHGAAHAARKTAPILSIAASRAPHASPAPPVLGPEAVRAARADAIRETIEAIRGECEKYAGGDWERWMARLAPLRDDLRSQLTALKPLNPSASGTFEAQGAVLEGKDGFPLFESKPDVYVLHIIDPSSLEPFRRDRPVVHGARWLKQKGIDVIFVPVPKMTEIYPEHFTGHCPPDRIIAPHIRQLMLELLEADVEVVDLLHALHQERDASPEPLYQPADPHWTPRGQAIAARMVAQRLARYDFVAKAQAAPSLCEWSPAPYPPASEGAAFAALNPDQRRRAFETQPRNYLVARNCTRSQYDETAPVACIGDSYNGGFIELLGREINMPIRALAAGGNTSDAFKGFLRDPEILKGCKVVVWLVCNSSLKNPWPMPERIRRSGPTAG